MALDPARWATETRSPSDERERDLGLATNIRT